MSSSAYLVLENSAVFEGRSFGRAVGADGVVGEVVFTTGMTGYIETLTDPSYYGQIIVQTFPMIGNYGVIPQDFESRRVQPRAYIVREWCRAIQIQVRGRYRLVSRAGLQRRALR